MATMEIDGTKYDIGTYKNGNSWRVIYLDSFKPNQDYLPEDEGIPGRWMIHIVTRRPIVVIKPGSENFYAWCYRESMAQGWARTTLAMKDDKRYYHYRAEANTMPVMREQSYHFKWGENLEALFHIQRDNITENKEGLEISLPPDRAHGIPPSPGTIGTLSRPKRPDYKPRKAEVISENFDNGMAKYTFRWCERVPGSGAESGGFYASQHLFSASAPS